MHGPDPAAQMQSGRRPSRRPLRGLLRVTVRELRSPIRVIASEAKQSIASQAEKWIASSLSLLAMTAFNASQPPLRVTVIKLNARRACRRHSFFVR
jgi:hypothetical protein